jgi:hypothetical protein
VSCTVHTIGRRDFGGTPDKRGALAAGKWVLHIIAVVFVAGIVFGITVPIGIALTASLGLVGYILYAFAPIFVMGLIPVINAISFLVVASLGWGIAIEKLFNVRLGTEG